MNGHVARRSAMAIAGFGAVCGLLAFGWFGLFALRPYEVTEAQMREAYTHPRDHDLELRLQPLTDRAWALTYRSFDGAVVNGRIHYPQPPAPGQTPFPVVLGAHAMGRSEVRWWQDRFNDSPTIEQTDALARLALERGHAVFTIDARFHGLRKDPQRPLQAIMRDLHYFGDRHDYEAMVRDTVLDHRLLLDWVVSNPALDASRISVAGYSMGAQVGLLLAGVDDRVRAVLAIVPPHIGNGTAIVAPLNAVTGLSGKRVWLVSADDDEYASISQNDALFASIPAHEKRHLVVPGSHILPDGYVTDLAEWFTAPPSARVADPRVAPDSEDRASPDESAAKM